MENIPYAPLVKLGLVGFLLLIIILLLVLAIRVGPMLISRIGTGNGNGKIINGTAAQQGMALRDAQRQLDELKAGNKPVQFWIDAYAQSATQAIQPLLRQNEEILALLRNNGRERSRRQQDRGEGDDQ